MKIEIIKTITISEKEIEPIMPLIEQLEENGFDTNKISLNDLSALYYGDAEIPIDMPKHGKIIFKGGE